MQMNIQIGRGAEALDERDHAGIGSGNQTNLVKPRVLFGVIKDLSVQI